MSDTGLQSDGHRDQSAVADNRSDRSFAARWTGDDARFVRRDGYMSPPFDEVTLEPGDVMDCDTFPVILPCP